MSDYGEDNPGLPLGHPFVDVQVLPYWTSTTHSNNSSSALVWLPSGPIIVLYSEKDNNIYAWCVRGETNGPAPVPKTGQTLCYPSSGPPWDPIDCAGTGQDGEYKKGVEWPNQRFTDNGDGTVTDNLTGLIWLKDASCFGAINWSNALSDVNGLANGTCELTDGSTAGDWRLPNVRELLSLSDYGENPPGLPFGHPFSNVQSNYWSSSTHSNPSLAFFIGISGQVKFSGKSANGYVWPVRGGND